jgi:hypothetical protein
MEDIHTVTIDAETYARISAEMLIKEMKTYDKNYKVGEKMDELSAAEIAEVSGVEFVGTAGINRVYMSKEALILECDVDVNGMVDVEKFFTLWYHARDTLRHVGDEVNLENEDSVGTEARIFGRVMSGRE